MENDDRLDRLTEREKVCLRHWLQHKSAKEIAADLGISHHAVEKRLKMARTKLGATSSLEAARMLGKAEGYGQTVAQSPDLAPHALPIQTVFTRPLILGAIAMSLIAAALLALLTQPLGETSSVAQPAQATSSAAADAERKASTEAAVRSLVAGVASGSPDYDKLAPPFAEIVRRDLPMTQAMFRGMGELKSMTFLERGVRGDENPPEARVFCSVASQASTHAAPYQARAWRGRLSVRSAVTSFSSSAEEMPIFSHLPS